ncbi:hypothetical protein PSACC_02948 [Paramicrosporidium saccamoebae]|uniref:Uncharacterized protein n=1 Tax=Paramicrosporidium saccamoebae TaxID=1246581 RepID=A0A2H9THL2_9FUNG|nr:hypothetical protein PSACC_02948 [Paramicrosporidium saccamoebae]
MNEEQYQEYQQRNPVVNEAKPEEDEIREELTAQDMELLEARSKPRVAHVPISVQRLETGPVKSQVVERIGPSADPVQAVARTQIRESIFKKRNATERARLEE